MNAEQELKNQAELNEKKRRFRELFLQERSQQLQYEAALREAENAIQHEEKLRALARQEEILRSMQKVQMEMRKLYDAMPAVDWFSDQEQAFFSVQSRLESRRARVGERLKAAASSACRLELDFTAPQVQARSIAPRPARHHRKMLAHEPIFFRVRSPLSGYLSVINLGTTGGTLLLYPNYWQPEGRIQANTFLDLPDLGSYEFGHLEGSPYGLEIVLALVTPDPLKAYTPVQFPPEGFMAWNGVGVLDDLLPKLERLAPGSWCFGEMSFEVVPG